MTAAVVRLTLLIAAFGAPTPLDAGKTLRVIVGLEAGGTVDTLARAFSIYLRKHIPGNPAILIQNMPGAGGSGATNYPYERDLRALFYGFRIGWRQDARPSVATPDGEGNEDADGVRLTGHAMPSFARSVRSFRG
jgi:hypothetical protein